MVTYITELKRSDIGVTYNVELHRVKDQNNRARQERAERVGMNMKNLLQQFFPAGSPTNSNKAKAMIELKIRIASEGSRCARFWAAELGRGYAKLFISWRLIDTTTNLPLACSGRLQDTSSAGCGAADICESDAGDRALDKMADTFAHRIASAVQHKIHV